MTDTTPSVQPSPLRRFWGRLWTDQRVWLTSALILAALAVLDPGQAGTSAIFATNALLGIAPLLLLSVGLAASAGATGADNLIARAFTGAPLAMIGLGALAGAVSPFCSCGVSTPEQNPGSRRRKSRPLLV